MECRLELQRLDGLQICQQSVDIEFRNLTYTVSGGRGIRSQKIILRGINGVFRSGRLTAVLGPSGAGKSSLLNVLSGFKTNGVSGSITTNGKERSIQEFRKLACYITQESLLLDLLRVRETLKIAADLKLNSKNGNSCKKDVMIDEILKILGLEKSKNTLVKDLSGGEKKRLSIAVELLTNPPVMIFDEPTSGLDSASSLQVINHLKMLAASGRTVVCTIHQPSSVLFDLFDDLYLINEGVCLYNGPVSQMKMVFEEAGFPCPRYYNRADFAIEVACHERGDNLQPLVERYNNIQASLNEDRIPSHEEVLNEESIMLQPVNCIGNAVKTSKNTSIEKQPRYPVPLWLQILILIKRTVLCNSRDIYLMYIRIITHIVVGIIIGVVCYGVGSEASKAMSNAACIFYIVLCLYMISPFVTVLVYPLEASVFLQEHQNNWYSLKAYFLSKILADIPFQIVCPTLLLAGAYPLTGQPYETERILKSWILCLLITINGQTMGLLLGAIFDAQLGLFMIVALNIPMSLFSGFFMRLDDIPDYLRWFTYVSYFRHSFQAEMLTIYGGDREKLKCSEDFCYFTSPHKILKDFYLTDLSYEINMCAMLLWLAASQLTFYLVLKWRIYKCR